MAQALVLFKSVCHASNDDDIWIVIVIILNRGLAEINAIDLRSEYDLTGAGSIGHGEEAGIVVDNTSSSV